jgi:hypothetical protein
LYYIVKNDQISFQILPGAKRERDVLCGEHLNLRGSIDGLSNLLLKLVWRDLAANPRDVIGQASDNVEADELGGRSVTEKCTSKKKWLNPELLNISVFTPCVPVAVAHKDKASGGSREIPRGCHRGASP